MKTQYLVTLGTTESEHLVYYFIFDLLALPTEMVKVYVMHYRYGYANRGILYLGANFDARSSLNNYLYSFITQCRYGDTKEGYYFALWSGHLGVLARPFWPPRQFLLSVLPYQLLICF